MVNVRNRHRPVNHDNPAARNGQPITDHQPNLDEAATPREWRPRLVCDIGSAALIALVHALKCEHKIVDPLLSGLSRRQLRARAEEIPGATGPRQPSEENGSVG
jgi:hypothetical protein